MPEGPGYALMYYPERVRRLRAAGISAPVPAEIVLAQVEYWQRQADDRTPGAMKVGVELDGQRWIYNSYTAWAKMTGLTSKQVADSIRALEAAGILQFKPAPGGRTKCYRIDYQVLQKSETVEAGGIVPIGTIVGGALDPGVRPSDPGVRCDLICNKIHNIREDAAAPLAHGVLHETGSPRPAAGGSKLPGGGVTPEGWRKVGEDAMAAIDANIRPINQVLPGLASPEDEEAKNVAEFATRIYNDMPALASARGMTAKGWTKRGPKNIAAAIREAGIGGAGNAAKAYNWALRDDYWKPRTCDCYSLCRAETWQEMHNQRVAAGSSGGTSTPSLEDRPPQKSEAQMQAEREAANRAYLASPEFATYCAEIRARADRLAAKGLLAGIEVPADIEAMTGRDRGKLDLALVEIERRMAGMYGKDEEVTA
jgi:hypothetical protein